MSAWYCLCKCLRDTLLTDTRASRTVHHLNWPRKISNRPKFSTELNENVLHSLETKEYKPKHHAGVIKSVTSSLPESITHNIRLVTKDLPLKSLIADSVHLNNYLHSRHLPPEEEDLRANLDKAASIVERKLLPENQVENEELHKKHRKRIQKILKYNTYSWKPVNYNEYQSKVYLVGRSPADYAVVHRVFKEINKRTPDFHPKSLFDFGSGVGTVTWAAKQFWEDSLEEYFSVDSSGCMNDVAQTVLIGQDSPDIASKGCFYRQFLPVSHTLKYDLVVSAFSLFELPSLKSRLETILTLWKKTQGYLIIIEQGTNAGFQVINEARDFILEFCNYSENTTEHAAHVFAPCPHDSLCPRFNEGIEKTPCNFEVPYVNPFNSTSFIRKERFSYVILKKGSRPEHDLQWPRIVRRVLPRSKHVVCRMCTSAGKLEEIVFTASKHGKVIYKCARASHWGDLLPISIKENEEVLAENGIESSNTECLENKM